MTVATVTTTLLGQRYRLLETLGTGAMGVVYRAFDRLTGEYVALKRVHVTTETEGETRSISDTLSDNDSRSDLRIALAEEFQILASLRHPNIVTVKDYGFDAERNPYFTMELLKSPQAIVEAAKDQTAESRVMLLVQLLQALAYLHRRGILHRDLKPGNVVVVRSGGDANAAPVIKTLDFGLSIERQRSGGTAGTLAYMAPEIFSGGKASESTDLYSAGIIAYEIFTGQHPYKSETFSNLIENVMLGNPDWQLIDTALNSFSKTVRPILQRLMSRNAEDRYKEAGEVIRDLYTAIGRTNVPEPFEIRESYLQAAKFVGRDAEMAWLAASLSQMINGQGAAWLVAGESGVGKSRLMSELRTLGSVWGTIVASGQAANEGGAPFHIWRDVIRRLALGVELSDLDASILKSIDPTLPTLLEREIHDAPKLGAQAEQARLFATITELISRQSLPVLMVLEDLQWADSGSQALFATLATNIKSRKVMMVGTFRDDEAPKLSSTLPGAKVLKLARFSSENIRELSESILGAAGTQPQVIELLERETEGNAFFVVEVVRTLADEAGQLDKIDTDKLPSSVFAGGILQLVQRRLKQVPATTLPMLRLAAVGGRTLDIHVLQSVDSGFDMESWLTQCASIAVLEIEGGQWRFAHDKLREGILSELSTGQTETLHYQYGTLLEQVYAVDLSPYYVDLALHFRKANATRQERDYSVLAGIQAAARFDSATAIDYFTRALELTAVDETSERARILLEREEIYDLMGARQFQVRDIKALEALAETTNSDVLRIAAALRRTAFCEITVDYPTALTATQKVVALAQSIGAQTDEASGYFHWGRILMRQGNFAAAQLYLDLALSLANRSDQNNLKVNILRNLGNVLLELGKYLEAHNYYEQSLQLGRKIGDQRGEGSTLNNLGEVARYEGRYTVARDYYQRALENRRITGERQGEALVLGNLGLVARHMGDYTVAQQCYERALQMTREVNDRYSENWSLLGLGFVAAELGQYSQALAYYEQTLELCQQTGQEDGVSWAQVSLSLLHHQTGNQEAAKRYSEDALALSERIGIVPVQAHALTNRGHALVALNDLDAAADSYRRALELRKQVGENHLAVECEAGLARVALAKDDLDSAVASVNSVLAYLDEHPLDGTEEPVRIYLTCYRVLKAKHDARATLLLYSATNFLQGRAAKIEDLTLRTSYYQNIQSHLELAALNENQEN